MKRSSLVLPFLIAFVAFLTMASNCKNNKSTIDDPGRVANLQETFALVESGFFVSPFGTCEHIDRASARASANGSLQPADVTWDASAGANSYRVKATKADDTLLEEKVVSAPSLTVNNVSIGDGVKLYIQSICSQGASQIIIIEKVVVKSR